MSSTKIAGASHAGHALAQLSAWPSVEAHRADCGVGIGVGTRAGQVLHLHDENHVSLRLTRPVIDRLRSVLTESGIDAVPDDDWVTMRLETPTDTRLLVMLVSVAIKANSAAPFPHPASGRVPSCAHSARRRTGRA